MGKLLSWLKLCACLFALIASTELKADSNHISGVVVDTEGQPIVGAVVMVQGSMRGVTTNQKGEFSVAAPLQSKLNVSFLGYVSQDFVAKKSQGNRIVLTEEVEHIGEVVVVGYATQEKATLTGALSTIKADDIVDAPVSNLSQAFAGRMSGVLTQQRSGQPGADGVSIRIRGTGTYNSDSSGALILVDGVERSMSMLDPNEIESVTVLKDASSTAVYGIRGANGVILVTTKQGQKGDAKVSYSGNFALQIPTRLPKILDSYNYASLYNEARWNDTANPTDIYSPEELTKYKTGSDPLMYPNIDWFDYCMKSVATQHKHNVSLSGGTNFIRYYLSLGYFQQNGLQKEFNSKYGYSNQDKYKKFNLRSNVNMTIAKGTNLKLSLGVARGERFTVPSGKFFWYLAITPPNLSPGFVDGKLICFEGKGTPPPSQLMDGLSTTTKNSLNLALELDQNLGFITKGLALRVKAAYDDDYAYTVKRGKNEPVYYARYADVDGEQKVVFRKVGEDGNLSSPSTTFSARARKVYGEAALTYKRAFGDHHLSALALMTLTKKWFHGRNYPGVPIGYMEGVGRITYNYAYKYLLEFNIGCNGSENFPSNSRFGVFPAFSAGWVITKEPFFKKIIPSKVMSYMKISSSYGIVGNDRLGTRRFLYMPTEYVGGNSVAFGDDRLIYTGLKQGKIGNPDITWERVKKFNFGIDTRWYNDHISFSFNYFLDKRDNILTPLLTLPSHVAQGSSDGYNIGKTENRGYEIELGFKGNIGKLSYSINGNYSFARNKILERDEVRDVNNPHLWRTGRRIGELFGYVFDGFFNSQEEIDRAPEQFGVTLRPGDVRYVDVNGDGVVNTNDMVPLKHPTFPEINYGFDINLKWKNFDLSLLFQGAANVSMVLGDNFKKPFDMKGNVYQHSVDRWHYVDADHTIPYKGAKYPRLTTNYGNLNNYYASSLWVKDASYLRLKNLVFGYTFRSPWLKNKLHVSRIRLYMSATNLFTISSMKIVDPEAYASNGLNYPNLRVVNFGVNIDF